MNMKSGASQVLNRRQVLANLGLMGAGAALTACGVTAQPTDPDNLPNLDAAILNFALHLEYLDSSFYLAAVGRLDELPGDVEVRLPPGFDGTTAINFESEEVSQFANELADNELRHVIALRRTIQDVLQAPLADGLVVDHVNGFTTALTLALGSAPDPTLTPFSSDLLFLHGGFTFEDVGVTAYKGAAPAITNRETVLADSAGFLAVEAYHASELRTLLYQRRDDETPFGLSVREVVQKISDLRASAGGGKDQGIVLEGRANIVPTDENGRAFGRTPREVANIILLDTTGTKLAGGFYPEGLVIPPGLEDEFAALLAITQV